MGVAKEYRKCRIMARPFGLPTLIAYPPPPYFRPAPFLALPRAPSPAPRAIPLVPRSRAYRKRHDCQFLPDMDVALQFVEARERINRVEGDVARRLVGRELSAMEAPLTIGLLMIVAPPVAVSLLWASPRFSRTAQVALTAYAIVSTLALAAVLVAVLRA